MYKTEQEIFSQYSALEKTYNYLLEHADDIRKLFSGTSYRSMTFIGSGSSYSLCKSAEISLKMRRDIQVNSMAAGDLMLNYPHYKNLIKDTMIVAPSRSGSTSEVIYAVKQAKKDFNTPFVCICAVEDSELSEIADLKIEIPWAFDDSVCQTRTVTNLYLVNLMLIAIMTDDKGLIEEIKMAVAEGNDLIERYTETAKKIGSLSSWDKVVVLADSELEGIAEEGALAFKEICQLPSNYYHLLDVRHGPMVLIDKSALVIMACAPYGESHQKKLIADLKNTGALVVTVSSVKENIWESDYNICVLPYDNYGVLGIPFIFIPQSIAYFKAVERGINPDLPKGLNSWIKL